MVPPSQPPCKLVKKRLTVRRVSVKMKRHPKIFDRERTFLEAYEINDGLPVPVHRFR
ncbi:UNVERIFIED_CONTAM: hypothetical protein Sradi_6892100 [Sesamum radiatum]|uniref:Uncharacterized protein n=1 Tax=Sesamum radiatum TaxID=300843 RepID=A0AAW2JIF6_SESRA